MLAASDLQTSTSPGDNYREVACRRDSEIYVRHLVQPRRTQAGVYQGLGDNCAVRAVKSRMAACGCDNVPHSWLAASHAQRMNIWNDF